MNVELFKGSESNFFNEYRSVLEKILTDMESFSDPSVDWIKSEFETVYGSFDLFTRSKSQCVNFISVTDEFISRLFGEKKADEFVDRIAEEASDFHSIDIMDSDKTIRLVIDWLRGARSQELIA